MPGPQPDVAASHSEQRPGATAELDAWHRLVIGGGPEQVSVARSFVRQVLGHGHPGAERVTLLTSELVTNSVNHSNSRREGGTITVSVRTAPDRVRVEVQDEGGPTAPTLCREGDLAEAGRGLRLVGAYSLTWDYHRNGTGTVTWFECLPEPLPLRIVGTRVFGGYAPIFHFITGETTSPWRTHSLTLTLLRLPPRPRGFLTGGLGGAGVVPPFVRNKKGLTGYLGAVLRPEGVEDAVAVRSAVGVRAEEVA